MKIAIIGDFHIPSRAPEIPEKIKKKLKEESPDIILCTGDLVQQKVLKQLESIAETKTIRGNMDRINFPETIQMDKQGRKITMIHGHQVNPRGNKDQLGYIAQEKQTDILIHGHTHQLETDKTNGKLLINPGSATGAPSGGRTHSEPSFVVLEINDKVKIRKIYEEREEEETYEFN